MHLSFTLLYALTSLTLLATTQALSIPAKRTSLKPIWLIAHKCLDVAAVDDAIKDGANAVEMDLTAYSDGWVAQHPGEQKWDDIRKLFEYIAAKKQAGANIRWI